MVTLADVARRAGVSTASASMVLSDRHQGRVSERTAQRVRETADQLGYVKDALAGGLRSRRTRTIGVISDEVLSTPYASNLMATVIATARELGWGMLVTDRGPDVASADQAVRELLERRVDRVIYASMYHHEVHLPAGLSDDVIVLNGFADRPGVLALIPDEAQGARDAVEHLIGLGHHRIGHVTQSDEAGASVAAHRRLDTYRATLRDHGMEAGEELVVRGRMNPDGADASARRLLDRPDRPTAVFCYNDGLAAGIYRQAYALGLSVPGDLSVVGFDDQLLIATNLDPRLTTVQLPHVAMADWAVRHVASGDEAPASSLKRFACPLVERFSCAPPPTA